MRYDDPKDTFWVEVAVLVLFLVLALRWLWSRFLA